MSLPESFAAPLSSAQWEAEFVRVIREDFETHDDPLISQLLDIEDNTLPLVAEHVRRYVTDFWKETNEDRSLLGAEIRRNLPSAIAGQKTSIRIFELLIARYRDLDTSTLTLNPSQSLEMVRAVLEQLELIQKRAPDAFNTKPMGYAGDLQTLCSLACLLDFRLGKLDYDTLATLLDCGRRVEGQDQEVEDGQNLRKRLELFRTNKTQLVLETEAYARSLPRK
jgi:hypothetical protein